MRRWHYPWLDILYISIADAKTYYYYFFYWLCQCIGVSPILFRDFFSFAYLLVKYWFHWMESNGECLDEIMISIESICCFRGTRLYLISYQSHFLRDTRCDQKIYLSANEIDPFEYTFLWKHFETISILCLANRCKRLLVGTSRLINFSLIKTKQRMNMEHIIELCV